MIQRPATPYELALHYRSMLAAITQFERYQGKRPDEIRSYLAADRRDFTKLLDQVMPHLTDEERAQLV